MNFPGRRTQEAAVETERMPVDAGWALAGLSLPSFVHSHLMVQERQQSYKVKVSVAHKHFAKRLRRAVQQQRSCALLRAYGLCFWNGKRIAGGFRPRLILKENWSCMLTGKSMFLSYTYSMTDLVLRNGFPYKSCRFLIFYHTFCITERFRRIMIWQN